MKLSFAVIALCILSGCAISNEFGKCVGVADEKRPDLEYKLSVWNLAMGVIFFEVIIPPIVVLADETFCPVGKK
jgi:hypothetical protein